MSVMTGTKVLAAGVAAATLIAAAPAAALVAPGHGGSRDRGGLTEHQLRAFETQVLGPEHAAEHARERAAFRVSGLRATSSAPVRAEAAAPNPQVGGRWISHFGIPVIGINAVMLPTGRVLWFAYPKNPNRRYGDKNAPDEAQAFIWDPARGPGAGPYKRVDPPIDSATGRPANIWCAGQALLPDG